MSRLPNESWRPFNFGDRTTLTTSALPAVGLTDITILKMVNIQWNYKCGRVFRF